MSEMWLKRRILDHCQPWKKLRTMQTLWSGTRILWDVILLRQTETSTQGWSKESSTKIEILIDSKTAKICQNDGERSSTRYRSWWPPSPFLLLRSRKEYLQALLKRLLHLWAYVIFQCMTNSGSFQLAQLCFLVHNDTVMVDQECLKRSWSNPLRP